MSARTRLLSLAWVCTAVLMRLYGINGGDAAIVGGLLFLMWTAPFGMIWQFYLHEYALLRMSPLAAQIVGDTVVVFVGFLCWFLLLPRLYGFLSDGRGRPGPK